MSAATLQSQIARDTDILGAIEKLHQGIAKKMQPGSPQPTRRTRRYSTLPLHFSIAESMSMRPAGLAQLMGNANPARGARSENHGLPAISRFATASCA